MINLVSVICFVLCCYHSNTVESEAVTNENGALIVVDTEVDDDDEGRLAIESNIIVFINVHVHCNTDQ